MQKAILVKDLDTGAESWESFDDFSRRSQVGNKIRAIVALAKNKNRTMAERLDSIVQGLESLY